MEGSRRGLVTSMYGEDKDWIRIKRSLIEEKMRDIRRV